MNETRNDRFHEKQNGHFFNGLLVGLILGFALALLFTTKKGRKMVKALTEEGLDSLSELQRRMDNIEVMIDESDEDEYVEPPVTNGEKAKKELKEDDEEVDTEEEPLKRGSKRHLFRGAVRRN